MSGETPARFAFRFRQSRHYVSAASISLRPLPWIPVGKIPLHDQVLDAFRFFLFSASFFSARLALRRSSGALSRLISNRDGDRPRLDARVLSLREF